MANTRGVCHKVWCFEGFCGVNYAPMTQFIGLIFPLEVKSVARLLYNMFTRLVIFPYSRWLCGDFTSQLEVCNDFLSDFELFVVITTNVTSQMFRSLFTISSSAGQKNTWSRQCSENQSVQQISVSLVRA